MPHEGINFKQKIYDLTWKEEPVSEDGIANEIQHALISCKLMREVKMTRAMMTLKKIDDDLEEYAVSGRVETSRSTSQWSTKAAQQFTHIVHNSYNGMHVCSMCWPVWPVAVLSCNPVLRWEISGSFEELSCEPFFPGPNGIPANSLRQMFVPPSIPFFYHPAPPSSSPDT